MTPGGDAFVVWEHNDNGLSVIQSSYRSAGGTWTDAVDVSADGGFASEPQVAWNPTARRWWSGTATVSRRCVPSHRRGTWRSAGHPVGPRGTDRLGRHRGRHGHAGRWRVAGHRGRAGPRGDRHPARGAGWGEPVMISDGEDVLEIVGPPEVGMDAQGNAVVVWYQGTMFGDVLPMIRATERTPEGSWAPTDHALGVVRRSEQPRRRRRPVGRGGRRLGTPAAGRPAPSWSRRRQARRRLLGHPVPVRPHAPSAVDPALAFGTGGTAVVIWGEATSFAVPSILHASTRAPGEAWSAPDDLSDPEVRPSAPRVAVDHDGNALAVWQGLDGEHATIQSRGFDGVGPALSAFRPTLRGAVHTPLRYSARARDAWSGVRKVVWTFGDGHRATGRRVEHRFRRPGVYRVRVTTSDRLGNVSVKRARTRVTRP